MPDSNTSLQMAIKAIRDDAIEEVAKMVEELERAGTAPGYKAAAANIISNIRRLKSK